MKSNAVVDNKPTQPKHRSYKQFVQGLGPKWRNLSGQKRSAAYRRIFGKKQTGMAPVPPKAPATPGQPTVQEAISRVPADAQLSTQPVGDRKQALGSWARGAMNPQLRSAVQDATRESRKQQVRSLRDQMVSRRLGG